MAQRLRRRQPITSYKLYRSTTPNGTYSVVAELLPTGDYQETTTPVGVTYYYKATAVNAFGESPFSNMTTNQSTAFGGPETFTSELCAPDESCYSDAVFASSGRLHHRGQREHQSSRRPSTR